MMSQFEFVFTLFGLLLGLSLAEVLNGFGNAVKARARLKIGWMTPLLGVFVMLDLISFWTSAWSMRDVLPANYLTLMLLLAFTGAYYVTANLVFPEVPDRCPDYDTHYWANKRLVLGAVLGLNLPSYIADWTWKGDESFGDPLSLATMTLFMLLVTAAAFAKGRRTNLILLILLIALYPFGALRPLMGLS